jgi:DNA-binding CsgD family transcriptional regulator
MYEHAMGRGEKDLVSVLEATYAQGSDDSKWLSTVAEAIAPHVSQGHGCNAFFYDTREMPLRVWSMCSSPGAMDPQTLMRALASATPEYVEQSWKRLACAAASEVPGWDEQPARKAFFDSAGIADVLALNAYDTSGIGCMIGAARSERLRFHKRERETFERVAAHLAAGFRLRMRSAKAEAVLSTSGAMLDARAEEAKLQVARAALRDAVRTIDRARGKLRRKDPEGAVESWRALVSAKWSLVEQFESDGKRFLVAMANEPTPPAITNLTPRERQVLELAAQGHTHKLIAYQLGLSDSTVRVLLARAAKRLGAKTTTAAVARWRKLSAHV